MLLGTVVGWRVDSIFSSWPTPSSRHCTYTAPCNQQSMLYATSSQCCMQPAVNALCNQQSMLYATSSQCCMQPAENALCNQQWCSVQPAVMLCVTSSDCSRQPAVIALCNQQWMLYAICSECSMQPAVNTLCNHQWPIYNAIAPSDDHWSPGCDRLTYL